MRISTNYNDYIKVFGYEEGMKKIKETGYDACDFYVHHCKSPLDTSDMPSEEEFVRKYQAIKEYSEKYGVEVYQTHAGFFTELDSYDPQYEKAYVTYIKKEIYATHLVGSRIMALHALQPYYWDPDKTPDRTFALNVRILKELCEYALPLGVSVALENMPRTSEHIPCNTPQKLDEHLSAVDMPNLGVCIDTGHANYTRFSKDAPAGCAAEDQIRYFGDKVLCLHIHDNMGTYDEHSLVYDRCMNGVNWDNVLLALKDIGYKGTFNSEANFSNRFPREVFLDAEKLQSDIFRKMLEKIGE